jgi:septal ring factor EnvC (AmiA/AmiB activator)
MPLMMAFPYENVLSEAELQALNKKLEQEISALESKQDDGADAQRRAEADSALEQEFAKSKNQIESLLSSILGGSGGGGTQ